MAAGAFAAQYRLARKLAEYSGELVYAAEDGAGGQRRVHWLAQNIEDPATLQRFRGRIRVLNALEPPATPRILELGEADGRPYAVTGAISGPTLAARLAAGPPPIAETLRIVEGLASALDAYHRRGVCHGDLRLSAIALCDDGPTILNLGYFGGGSVKTDSAVEATALSAPEVCADGAPPTPRSDVWSLGVILYSLLAGRLPFEGDYAAAVIYEIQHEEPPPLPIADSGIAAGLPPLIEKALAKHPEDRQRDAAQLLDELRALGEQPDATAPSPLPSASETRRSGLSRRRALGGGFVALTILAAAGIAWRISRPSPERRAAIAVLPLRNLAASGEDYFAEGLTDELITSLARIAALRVISRTSVMQFRERQTPTAEIARQLAVDYLLDGSAQRRNERVRITVTLIDAKTDEPVWAESYDRRIQDVFDLQSDLAREIAAEVRVLVTPDELLLLANSRTVRASTYETYLRGRYLLNRRRTGSLEQARDLFLSLAEDDPDFAPGYAGLADTYVFLATTGAAPPDELWPKALAASDRALELDPNLAEARSTRGLIRSFYEWKWDEAEEDYREALRLNPSNGGVRQRYGIYLSRVGRHDEAIEELERALASDPLSTGIQHTLGVALYMARRFDAALERFQRNRDFAPGSYRTHWYLGRCYLALGRFDDSAAEFEEARRLSNDNPFLIAAQAHALAVAGETEKARELLNKIQNDSANGFVSASSLALPYLGLGDTEQALAWLEQAFEESAGILVWLGVDPVFDPLRGHPRFERLVQATGLAKAP